MNARVAHLARGEALGFLPAGAGGQTDARVDGQERALISDDVRLDLTSPGPATFCVRADQPLKGLVTLDIGYNERTPQRHQQRVDADGNWLRQTDGKIQDKAIERGIEALQNAERYQSSSIEVDDHSSELVGGIKKIEALGALKLLSGGSASLAAVDDLHQATGRDLNLVVGQKYNATVGDDMQERIQGIRRSIAPQTWLGSADVNVLQALCDLLDLVEAMNSQIASHVHASSPPPNNAGDFSGNAGTAAGLARQLKPITALS